MAKLYLFEHPVPYKWVKEAFVKVIDEYLPTAKFEDPGDSFAWTQYLTYFIEHNGPYITDRVSSVFFKEVVNTYLEFVAVPCRAFLHLFDGVDQVQRYVRVYDEYPIKGIFLAPEMKEKNPDPNKEYPGEEGIAEFIKTVVETKYSLENTKIGSWLRASFYSKIFLEKTKERIPKRSRSL